MTRCLLVEGRACATFPGAPFAPRHTEIGQAVALVLGVKKQACSDWDRRKRRTDKEGVDVVGLGAGLISSRKHGVKFVCMVAHK